MIELWQKMKIRTISFLFLSPSPPLDRWWQRTTAKWTRWPRRGGGRGEEERKIRIIFEQNGEEERGLNYTSLIVTMKNRRWGDFVTGRRRTSAAETFQDPRLPCRLRSHYKDERERESTAQQRENDVCSRTWRVMAPAHFRKEKRID